MRFVAGRWRRYSAELEAPVRLLPGRGTNAAQSQRPSAAQNQRAPASAALQEGWSEAEVCAEKLPLRGGLCAECPGGSHSGSIGKKSTIGKKSAIGKKRAKMGNLH